MPERASHNGHPPTPTPSDHGTRTGNSDAATTLAQLLREAESLHAALGTARTQTAKLIAGLHRAPQEVAAGAGDLALAAQLGLAEVAEYYPRQRRSSCRSDNPVRQAGGVGQDCPTYFLAGVILELVARHGDDAARALMRHPGLAQSVIASCGAPGARALAGLRPLQARRLAMLIDDGTLSRLGRSQEVLQVIEKYGDRGLNFLWDHKGALAVGTILTAFLADPAAFLKGARELGGEAAGLVTKPVLVSASRMEDHLARSILVAIAIGVGGVAGLVGWRIRGLWTKRTR